MRGRFAARNLKHIGFAFCSDQSINGCPSLFDRFVLQAWPAISVAHRTRKIAIVGNLKDRDTSVLFMFAAKTTIKWASSLRFDKRLLGKLGRKCVVVSIVPFSIAANEVFSQTMNGTSFAKIDSITARNNLGRDDL
jgi:hypothetical protein